MDVHLIEQGCGFSLEVSGRVVLQHSTTQPCAFVGVGAATVAVNRGNFRISDYVSSRIALTHAVVAQDASGMKISLAATAAMRFVLELEVRVEADSVQILPRCADPALNRFWLRLVAEPDEHLWGGGEQLSYFNLRGRRFPLWTSEPGVGRDKTTCLTFEADRANGGGGDYYNTNYPQPTYISSRRYALHLQTTAYSAFDFRHDGFHELEIWAVPEEIRIWAAAHFTDLVSALSLHFGRQPRLPAWVLQGAIIGLKEGARSLERLESFVAADAAVCGLWCEDWVGVRETSFGTRLFWDWKHNGVRYPGLEQTIQALAARNIRFLGYINPYLCVDGSLYPVARTAGYLVRRLDSEDPYLVDFGEFVCGMIDLTHPAAVDWFQEQVIGRNLLDFGLSGWMADFGEYLPPDVRLASGVDGMLAHNAWPTLWAKVNADAVARRGKTGEVLYFMRAGFTGVQRFCPLLWAGDQSVDFSRHDGLQTVICAALSSGLLGNAYHHSDIGGYTSLFGNVRTPELIQRWAEMAAFTAVMRTHEGNRPAKNLQIDQDPQVLRHFARMTRIYRHLAPYLTQLSREAADTGLPLQRPLFLHFESDSRAYEGQTAYLLGPDLLVAPVIEPGVTRWQTYLPAGASWIHVWSATSFVGGASVEVAAPLGQPPVFYRQGSAHEALFAALARL